MSETTEIPDGAGTGLGGALDRAMPEGKKSLSSTADIEGLVRDFVSGVWQRAVRGSRGDGGYTIEQAAKDDQAEARALIEVVAGRDDGWAPAPSWTPGQDRAGLLPYLRQALDGVCSAEMLAKEPDGPIEGLAVWLLGTTYEHIQSMPEKTEAELREDVDGLVELAVHMLMGLPLIDE